MLAKLREVFLKRREWRNPRSKGGAERVSSAKRPIPSRPVFWGTCFGGGVALFNKDPPKSKEEQEDKERRSL